MSVVWTEPHTLAAPKTKKRKDTPLEHRHTTEEWEAKRDRITELFEDNELLDVAALLEAEGFVCSIPQLRHRLKIWGHWKYLKLSEKQWRYIGQKLARRLDEGKEKTAFKLHEKKIPSSRLEKDLTLKTEEDNFDLRSLKSAITISSCELSAYTSSTAKGITIKTYKARGGGIDNNLPSISEYVPTANGADAEYGADVNSRGSFLRVYQRLLDAEQQLMITKFDLVEAKKRLAAAKRRIIQLEEEAERRVGDPLGCLGQRNPIMQAYLIYRALEMQDQQQDGEEANGESQADHWQRKRHITTWPRRTVALPTTADRANERTAKVSPTVTSDPNWKPDKEDPLPRCASERQRKPPNESLATSYKKVSQKGSTCSSRPSTRRSRGSGIVETNAKSDITKHGKTAKETEDYKVRQADDFNYPHLAPRDMGMGGAFGPARELELSGQYKIVNMEEDSQSLHEVTTGDKDEEIEDYDRFARELSIGDILDEGLWK